MEALILAIYSFFVWLIFIKLKWLPWNTYSQVTVVVIPIVGLTALILTLNVVAPSTAEVRVIKYVVQVVPQVRGRVIEVPVEPNRVVTKGTLLFRIDPTPFLLQVQTLEAQLANAKGSLNTLEEQLRAAQADSAALRAKLQLAEMRVKQNAELASTGAGDRFALEEATSNLGDLRAQLRSSTSAEEQVRA